ncbi:lysophosphatidic acid receptor 6-like [Engraulis encrasicolus]|uniref:lysophosphatidic acid receptor 6-like n=1 Tax=Engraulis encrasicolus TaxID=184585 RepID=UPI002FCF2E00
MITMSPASSNTTWSTNSTDFDIYCTEMPAGGITWGVLSILCACVGLPASVWLMWVLVQRQRSGLTNDTYMFNLTVMDLILNVFTTPFLINYFVLRNDFLKSLGELLHCFSAIGRPLFMTCICVDCFMAVVYPITYMKMKRYRYRLLSCVAVWGITLCVGMINAFILQFFSPISGILCWLLVPTIAICDLTILYTLRKPDPSGRSEVHPQKQRALQTITNSLVMTLVCYLPTMAVGPFLSFIPMDQFTSCVMSIPYYIAPLLGGIAMPLLQLHSLGRLRGLLYCTRDSGSPERPDQWP